MTVFGQAVPRDASLYLGYARDSGGAAGARALVAQEQGARSAAAVELASAWQQFRSASTESQKQAILAEISQIEAEDRWMGSHRGALMDDIELADRQERDASRVRAAASDEGRLAESALLNGAAGDRARAAEGARMATLGKAAQAQAARDYTGLRVWTTADAGGASP
jgi:hypothetical protein